MKEDPCFRCPLPECDDRSPRCVIRQLSRSYYNKLRNARRDEITEDEREGNNLNFDIWHRERAAEASEGGRPYKRTAR